MTDEEFIASYCNPRTWERAQRIAAQPRGIRQRKAQPEGNLMKISASVEASSTWGPPYRTTVTLDAADECIDAYSCTCPAYHNYDGLCKHCAALAIVYLREPESFEGAAVCAPRKAATSFRLASMLERAAALEKETLQPGRIEVVPTLRHAYSQWSVEFRIEGFGASYVMKSITDFATDVELGKYHEYGKKLGFVHALEMFTPRSARIVQLLIRLTDVSSAFGGRAFAWSSSSYGRFRTTAHREMNISESEVALLLDCYEPGEAIECQLYQRSRQAASLRIEELGPDFGIAIRQREGDGFCLTPSCEAKPIGKGTSLYLLSGATFLRCPRAMAGQSEFMHALFSEGAAGVTVAAGDMPLFCAAILPRIEKDLPVAVPPEVDALRPKECRLEFYFDKVGRTIRVKAKALYGDVVFTIAGAEEEAAGQETKEGAEPVPLRDTKREARALALVDAYFGDATALPLADEDAACALLFGGLAEFRGLGEVFTTPAFDRLIREKPPRIDMGVSLSGDLINLDVRATDLSPADLAAVLSAYRKHERYHRLSGGAFISLEDMELSQLDRIASDLGITLSQLANGAVELPSFRAFYLDAEDDLERDRTFTSYLEGFRATDERAYEVPPQLEGVLRRYQAEGFRWLSARCDAGFDGILADEMGLGKSVQLISLLLARKDEARETGPSLIVCPASLVYNWLAEFERFAPDLEVRLVTGTAAERQAARAHAFEGGADVLVTSYDLARIDAKGYEGRRFFVCALDEAQYIKNPGTKTTKAVKRIDAAHRFALTGTPMENRLSELWSIFDFLMPGLLGPYTRFRERFEEPVVGGDEAAAKRLQAIVGPFLLRREKTAVLTDLPEKLESVVYAQLEGRQRQLYDAHEQKLREELTAQRKDKKKRDAARRAGEEVSAVEILAELTRLRQIACDPRLLYENYAKPGAKVGVIFDTVAAAVEGGEKVLVFSQFTSFLELVGDELSAKGLPYFVITGATPKRKRLELVNRFNEGDTPVFLISLKAGGTGLNLTGASVVVHADPWWNAAAQDQATDRAHRIGQKKVVSVQKIIAKDTIEERIVRLQEEKRTLAGRVVAAGGSSLAGLSRDDLLELLCG